MPSDSAPALYSCFVLGRENRCHALFSGSAALARRHCHASIATGARRSLCRNPVINRGLNSMSQYDITFFVFKIDTNRHVEAGRQLPHTSSRGHAPESASNLLTLRRRCGCCVAIDINTRLPPEVKVFHARWLCLQVNIGIALVQQKTAHVETRARVHRYAITTLTESW